MLLIIRSFIIISLRSCFVKNFFKLFFALDFSNPQQLLYHIIFKTFCQELFFKCYDVCSDRSPSATFTSYHFSTLFVKNLFQILFSMLLYFVLPHRQRSIYYHYFQPVSTLFLCFFNSSAICSLTLKTLVYFSLLYGKKQIITKRHLASG